MILFHCMIFIYFLYKCIKGHFTTLLNHHLFSFVKHVCVFFFFIESINIISFSYREKTAGTIAGIVIGSVVGSILFVSIMIFVCVKVFKKTNRGRVIVRPAQAVIFYSDTSSQSTPEFLFQHPCFTCLWRICGITPSYIYPSPCQGNP